MAPRWVGKSRRRKTFSGTITIQAAKRWILAAMPFWFYLLLSGARHRRHSVQKCREQSLVWTIQCARDTFCEILKVPRLILTAPSLGQCNWVIKSPGLHNESPVFWGKSPSFLQIKLKQELESEQKILKGKKKISFRSCFLIQSGQKIAFYLKAVQSNFIIYNII